MTQGQVGVSKSTVKVGQRTWEHVIQYAHFAEELWTKVTFVFVRKSLTGRTAVRKIHSALAWWPATSDGTAEARHG